MKCQISSIIVTPPKIIGRMFCQSQLMAPTGEQATLMVISSFPGTECSGRVVRAEAQARRKMPLGVGREAAMETLQGSDFPSTRVTGGDT